MAQDDGKPPKAVGLMVTERVAARPSTARDIRRADTHPGRTATPIESFEEDLTGKYDVGSDELREARAKRPTDKRFEKLEAFKDQMLGFKDEVVDRLGKVEVAVADMNGQFKIIPDLIDTMKSATTAMQQREHVTFTAQVDVEKAQAISEAQTKTIRARGDVAVRKMRWQTIGKLVAGIVAVATALAGAFAAGRC